MAALHRALAGIVALVCIAAPAQSSAQGVQRTHGPDPVSAVTPTAHAAATASDWCANTDPAANQYANGDYRYHAVYAHPADRPSRLAAIGAELEGDAFGASALLEHDYGRAIRFDIGTPCGPGQLDISDVELPFTEEQLGTLATTTHTGTFEAVATALRERGFAVASNDAGADQLAALHENFLVWLDGPAPAGSCGQGTALLDSTRSETNLNNMGGKLALIFRNGRDFCGADVVRHEIGHNLGALQPDAPHTTDGVHCNDAFEDTMCEWTSPKLAGGPFNGLYFDYGNDDYWDPPQGAPLGWWTLNLSRFICPDAACNRPPTATDRSVKSARKRRVPVLRDPRAQAERPHRRSRRQRHERRQHRRKHRAGSATFGRR